MTGQEQVLELYDEDDYTSAQRAAVEAVSIGRATLETAVAQGEELDRAEKVADETQYALDKATRIVRGMTWSGWVANAFSKGPEAPVMSSVVQRKVPDSYEGYPPMCQEAAQAVQNYHLNVKVLESCEAQDQKETCRTICDSMQQTALSKVKELPKTTAYRVELESHITILTERQADALKTKALSMPVVPHSSAPDGGTRETTVTPPPSAAFQLDPHYQKQEDHLQFMAGNLSELSNIATNLHTSLSQQQGTLNCLEEKTENITETSKMVTRRADKIIQRRSWTPTKAVLDKLTTIRHVRTGHFLSVQQGKYLVLVPYVKNYTAVFEVWKRQGNIFGLKNRDCSKWLGQNMFGSITGTATSFGQRQEWEADDNEEETKLLCASAGWGVGGYLVVHSSHDGEHTLYLSGSGAQERKTADLWSIREYVPE